MPARPWTTARTSISTMTTTSINPISVCSNAACPDPVWTRILPARVCNAPCGLRRKIERKRDRGIERDSSYLILSIPPSLNLFRPSPRHLGSTEAHRSSSFLEERKADEEAEDADIV